MAQFANPAYRIRQGEFVTGFAWSNTAVILQSTWRVLYDDGTEDRLSTDALTTGSARAVQVLPSNQVALKDGYLVEGVVVSIGGPAQRGSTYVQMFIAGSPDTITTVRQIICAGYTYGGHAPTLGEIVEPGPAGGPGQITTLSLGDPAAGAEFAAYTLAAGQAFKIRGFDGTLVNAAAAANRLLTVFKKNAATSFTSLLGIAAGLSLTGETHDYQGMNASPSLGNLPVAWTGFATIPVMFSDELLTPTDVVTFLTLNLNAGDNWGSGNLTIEEWVMPN